ncbi:MAG: arylamine N-acetyltransferase family protein [Anaerolineales bacterium]
MDAYFHRIGYAGPRTPNANMLRALHRVHMLSVPFENLDIARRRPIVLEEAKLFEKIVVQRRGGFCYELNGLFAGLLRALGFRVDLLNARVYDTGQPGPDFDHMGLVVHLEQRWLVDVGFGDCFHEPLLLDDTSEQRRNGADYHIASGAERWVLSEKKPLAEWLPAYDFDLKPRELCEYEDMCIHQQTSPESIFTRKRICSLATPEGRISLSDNRLIITRNGERTERELSDSEYTVALHQHFGITFSS